MAERDSSYVISVAAARAGVHPQTLRIYERKGLLDPTRTPGGTRRYSDRDIEQMRRIQRLTGAGVNLEGVRRILALETELDELREKLEDAIALTRVAVEETHRRYRRDLVPFTKTPLPVRRWRR